MAHLEAASVPAFVQLERELHAHGAPERLVAAARRARQDEERHAFIVTGLARANGARPPPLDVAPTPAFADARVRTIFADLAVDERRHADLAWAVDAWIAPQLGDGDRRLVEHARRIAIEERLVSTRA